MATATQTATPEDFLVQASRAIYDRLTADTDRRMKGLEAYLSKMVDGARAEANARVDSALEREISLRMDGAVSSFQAKCMAEIEAMRRDFAAEVASFRALVKDLNVQVQVQVPEKSLVLNVPAPRRTKKHISYDELGRPSVILEIEEK